MGSFKLTYYYRGVFNEIKTAKRAFYIEESNGNIISINGVYSIPKKIYIGLVEHTVTNIENMEKEEVEKHHFFNIRNKITTFISHKH
ncbi:hypothetical protein [Bacillus sp. EB600]|uniref:hypothetical protein n=1 Tax=Bacillus sp. EB600 TaxID=2806345 RepID=UPI0021092156|nr:hypothetical protein [Bacillus sp. EB600]MCQ6282474.1 hypothetical protein [Bacillus sp. EB600]